MSDIARLLADNIKWLEQHATQQGWVWDRENRVYRNGNGEQVFPRREQRRQVG